MQVNESMTRGDRTRVQELYRQVLHLVSRSQQQRRAIDRLVAELNALGRRAERRLRGAGPTDERSVAASALSTRGPR